MASLEILQLGKKRWALPVLALLARGAVLRAYPLGQTLGCSRAAITGVITHLRTLGLLRKNPGHGHPLRPEFQLTAKGKAVAISAEQVWRQIETDQTLTHIALARWSLPILQRTHHEMRYGQLRRDLAPITDRALSMSLQSLTRATLLIRRVDMEQRPPASLYQSSKQGQALVLPLSQL